MGREALRQVKPGAMRDTLAVLQKDGWTFGTMNGGHIRLEHPDAPGVFVTAPKTAPDIRAALNVRSDCRRTLKMSAEARLLASTTPQLPVAPSRELPLLQEPSRRKRGRWTAAERARQALVAEVQAAAPSEAEIEALRILIEGPTQEEAMATVQGLVDGIAIAAPETAPEALAPATEAADALSAKIASVLAPKPRRRRAARPVEAPAPTQAPTQAAAGLPQVDPAALDFAMKLLSGQMQRLEITADMVGMTLAYQGEIVMVGATPVATLAATPAANAEPAASRKRIEPSATRVDRGGARFAGVRAVVLSTLGALGEWVSNQDLAELVYAEAGYEAPRSMAGMLAAVLDGLRQDGLLETRHERNGRALRAFHRTLAA